MEASFKKKKSRFLYVSFFPYYRLDSLPSLKSHVENFTFASFSYHHVHTTVPQAEHKGAAVSISRHETVS